MDAGDEQGFAHVSATTVDDTVITAPVAHTTAAPPRRRGGHGLRGRPLAPGIAG